MKKSWIIIGVIVILFFVLYRMFVGGYNSMVEKEEAVSGAWSQVENVYQRRSDLIPNIVASVKGEANFEKSTLVDVINARASATRPEIKVDPSKITPESVANFQQAQDGLSSALGRLLITVEKYPELKANKAFSDLRVELEGTENRIAVERKRFNEVVQDYNAFIRKFPKNIVASMFDFEKKGYFEATKGAEKAPEVKF
ncbi:MAG: LemA family protein [Bacteroidota bacterium]